MPVGKILYLNLRWKSLQFLTSFIVNAIFARSLQSVVAAEFYTLVYTLSLIISFFTLGLDISLNYCLARRAIRASLARRLILVVTFAGLVAGLALMALLSSAGYPHLDIHHLLILSGLHIAGGLFASLSAAIFTAGGRSHVPARMAFVVNMVMIGASLFCDQRYSGLLLIHIFFYLYFIGSFLQGLVLFILSRRLPAYAPVSSSMRLISIFRFSFFVFLTNLIFFVANRLYIYMIPYFYTPYEQGNYIQAYKIVEYAGIAMSFTYYPFIALVAESGQRMKDHLLMLVRLSNTVVLVFSAVILVAGHWLFPFLFGPSFDRMFHLFVCFIPGVFALCSSAFFTAWYFGTGQIRYNIISACILLVTMPTFFFFLGGPTSAEAAAFGFSLANILSLAYDVWIYRKLLHSPISSMLLSRPDDLRVLARLVKTQLAGRS